MKKLLLVVTLAALTWSCAEKKNAFRIHGDVKGLTETIYLVDETNTVIDSAAVDTKGIFEIKGIVEEPYIAYLRGAQRPFAMFFVEPGRIEVKGDLQGKIEVSGTNANIANQAFATQSEQLMQRYREPGLTEEQRKQISDEYDALLNKTMEQNTDNVFGVYLLSDAAYGMSGQEILDAVAKFSPEMQRNKMLAELKEMGERKVKVDVGKPYIEISQPDPDGKPIALSSLIGPGKYVLVDFWASWCGPCMAEIPHLVRTYDAFHGKGFEIYGVSFDSRKEDWLKAVEQNKMVWPQVSELKGFDNQAAKDYAVQGIPSNFLIGPDGKIVATNLRGEELYEKVSEVLND